MRPLIKWVGIVIITILFILLVLYFGIFGGIINGVIGGLLVLVLANYDRAMLLSSSLFKFFSKISFWAEKRSISNYLQGTINIYSKSINSETETNLLPHGIKIKWAEPKDRDAFIKEGKAIVCLEPSKNEARNLARATMLYVAEDLVHDSRRYVDPKIMKSADFAIARKMLSMNRKLDALRYLNQEFIQPEINKMPIIASYLQSMEKMDAHGTLTRVLLREFSELDAKLPPQPTNKQAKDETVDLTKVLTKLAEKKRGIDVYPEYRGKIIRVAIMLIARAGTLFLVEPYVRFAKWCAKEKIPHLYVMARGENNISLSQAVIREIEKHRLFRKQNEWKYQSIIENSYVDTYLAFLKGFT